MKWFIFLITALWTTIIFGQANKKLNGDVMAFATSAPIPYANISIIGTNNGTCADHNGKFKISLEGTGKTDSLLVSAIGYESKSISLYAINESENALIRLVEKVHELPSFELEAMKLKEITLGKKSKNKAWGFMRGENGGAQFGRLFNPKGENVMIDMVDVMIANAPDCDSGHSKLRLRIYSIENSLQEEDLLNQNIFVEIDDSTQWTSIDLSDYELFTNDKFMIGFEWLFDKFTCPVVVAIGGKGTKSYYRLSSHGEWRPTFDMNWAIKVTLLVEESDL